MLTAMVADFVEEVIAQLLCFLDVKEALRTDGLIYCAF